MTGVRFRVAGVALTAALVSLRAPPAAANCHIASFDINALKIEEAEGAVKLMVEVEGTGPITCTGTIRYKTVDGTATATADYATTSGKLEFKPGADRQQSFRVPIVDDALVEGDERFTVEISADPGGVAVETQDAKQGGPVAQVRIVDNDGAAAASSRKGGSGGLIAGILVFAAASGGAVWMAINRRDRATARRRTPRRKKKRP